MTGSASAPGSAGNLGPGFDVLALAIELRCRVLAEPAGAWSITQDGEMYEPPPDDLVRVSVAAMAEGPFRLEIENEIPVSRGLGSSAAVAVAAGAAAMRSVGAEPESRFLFDVVTRIEGHADNSAASVHGGLVAAGNGVVRHLEVHEGLRVIVGIPEAELQTSEARAALTAEVDRSVVVRSLARLVFLVEGLRTGDPVTLAAAGGDELHEVPRHDLSPITAALMGAAIKAGALHAGWSGAGPSAIAFAPAQHSDAVREAMAAALGGTGMVRPVEVATEGWR